MIDLPFQGAKIALLCGDDLVAYVRDDIPTIHDPGRWDLPGGIREAGETPLACALRETWEEFGITLPPESVFHSSEFIASNPTRRIAFFMAHISQATVDCIRFGDEGQFWRMMPVAEFLSHECAVVALQDALRAALSPRYERVSP